ncbi:DEAD/DEAH box helicase [Enhygromyxa salina]|uniref:ATP-dependent RNA helicase DbpA n=1 Tax=Enhygromyxa salina TaxID=215803 RepID=A0A2S9YKS0_9BACT|nr:DEAD/DEAH box helicase [Enhygromyxa salina]PRQ05626.1 ATP-dependent RNA helicase DbpA [Enhygromyxa salina]
MELKGFTTLTAVQRAVVDQEAVGKNLRISSQTGSGKTVAIGIALHSELADTERAPGNSPSAILITPTRELANQVRDELSWLYANLSGMHVTVVTGGTDIGRERRALERRPRLVVGTPGRMLDHLRSGALDCSAVKHVVLDEADQMFDMGFRDELESIIEQLPAERLSHLVSATFPRQVRTFADNFQGEYLHIQGTKLGAANEDIQHVAFRVRPHDRYAALINELILTQDERCLVFVRRRADAAELAENLAADGFSALPLSGDLPQAQRTRTLNAFRNGLVKTLVATDVASRGIDVADISMVVHYDLPEDPSAYTHRSGRTGRAGQQGRSLLLVAPQAEGRIRRLWSLAKIEGSWVAPMTPAKVRKTLRKKLRKQLHDQLAADESPSEEQLEYAQTLLARFSPELLVSRLLEIADPPLPREPMEVGVVEPRGPRSGSDARSDAGPRSRGGSGAGPRSGPRAAYDGPYQRYSINWGHRAGATPARLLAHICRRGDISSQAIGALRIEVRSSTFEVAQSVATQFESRARVPDSRDPNLHIEAMGDSGGDGARLERGSGDGKRPAFRPRSNNPRNNPRNKGPRNS